MNKQIANQRTLPTPYYDTLVTGLVIGQTDFSGLNPGREGVREHVTVPLHSFPPL